MSAPSFFFEQTKSDPLTTQFYAVVQRDQGDTSAETEVKTFGRKRRIGPADAKPVTSWTVHDAENVALPKTKASLSSGQSQQTTKPIFCKQIAASNLRRPLVQMHLDFGQANFVCNTCKVCGMVYAKGEERDEKLHAAFHNSTVMGISFQGWQQERVVRTCENGSRIIAIHPGELQSRSKKIADICKVIEAQLGMTDGWLLKETCKMFLMISPLKRVTGALVIEGIRTAFTAVPAAADDACPEAVAASAPPDGQQASHSSRACGPAIDRPSPNGPAASLQKKQRGCISQLASGGAREPPAAVLAVDKTQPRPARLGVRGIWVSVEARRSGIATRLLDAARVHSTEAVQVGRESLAFSQPTEDGTQLARRYTGTSSFLVYLSSA